MVPTKTTKAETASKTLFKISAVSRLTIPKIPWLCILAARNEKSVSAPPTKNIKMPRITTPLSGSLAKA